MALRLVTVVLANAPFQRLHLHEIDALPHVVETISWFLLDLHAMSLRDAVQLGNARLVGFLVGYDPEVSLGKGFDADDVANAMKEAIAQNLWECFELLATSSMTIECCHEKYFHAAFTAAAFHDNRRVLEWIYRHRRMWCTDRALTFAAVDGHLEVVRFLVERQLSSRREASSAAELAVARGHHQIVEFLVKRCEIDCLMCLTEAALRRGSLKQAAWLHELDDGNEMVQVNKTRACEVHKLSKSLADRLQNNFLATTIARKSSLDELTWLEDHFPHVFIQIRRKILLAGCKSGDLDKIHWLFERGLEDKEILEEAVQTACRSGSLNVVKFFILKGHTISSLDDAVKSGDLALVRYLQRECGVSHCEDLEAAIDAAVCDGHVEMVQLFDFQRQKPYPAEAFSKAAKAGDLAMIRFLTSRPHDCRILVDALNDGFRSGQLEAVKLLYAAMTESEDLESLKTKMWSRLTDLQDLQNFYYSKDLESAACAQVLCFLLGQENQVDEQHDFRFVVGLALRTRHLELLKLLHDKGAYGLSYVSLDKAVCSGSLAIVRLLHKNTSVSCSPIAMDVAAEKGYLHIVEFLHYNRSEGCTSDAILNAAARGHWKVVRFLRQHRSEGNVTLLHAVALSQLEVVKYLWSLEPRDWELKELLRCACKHSTLAIVMWLWEKWINEDIPVEAIEAVLEEAKLNADQRQQQRIVAFLTEQMVGP